MRRILSFLRLNSIRTDPPNPAVLELSDQVQQSLAVMHGLGNTGLNAVRVNPGGLIGSGVIDVDGLEFIINFTPAGGSYSNALQTVDVWAVAGLCNAASNGRILFSNDGVTSHISVPIPYTGGEGVTPSTFFFHGWFACRCQYIQVTNSAGSGGWIRIIAYKYKARGA